MADNTIKVITGIGLAVILGVILFGIVFQQTGTQTQGCLVTGESWGAGATEGYNGSNYNASSSIQMSNYPYLILSLSNSSGYVFEEGTDWDTIDADLGTYAMLDTADTDEQNTSLVRDYRWECSEYIDNASANSILKKVPTILIAFVVLTIVSVVTYLFAKGR